MFERGQPKIGFGVNRNGQLLCVAQTTVWVLAFSFLDERIRSSETLKGNGAREMKRGKLMMIDEGPWRLAH